MTPEQRSPTGQSGSIAGEPQSSSPLYNHDGKSVYHHTTIVVPPHERVLRYLRAHQGAPHVDVICRDVGLDRVTVGRSLGYLELMHLARHAGMYWTAEAVRHA